MTFQVRTRQPFGLRRILCLCINAYQPGYGQKTVYSAPLIAT
jgi:hypothetical protein